MATHDYNIANQSFSTLRSDLNGAFSAILSSNSDTSGNAPTTTVKGQLFYDTTNNKLQVATDTSGTFVDVALNSSGNLAVTGTMTVGSTSTFTGEITANGGIALGDSDKATFGASDDLEIYHDGSNSYIDDSGTGNLNIRSSRINFQKYTGETMAEFIADGATSLRYDNSTKLATTSSGIDVTGTIESDTSIAIDYVSGSSKWTLTSTSGDDLQFDRNGTAAALMDGSTRDFHADGDVIAYSTTISDERLKTGIHTIQDALDKVYSLKGVEFTYKADGKRSAGLIAQDVEKVLPSAVSEKQLPLKVDDGNEYKVLQYDQTIGLLVEAVKELKDLVDEQAQEIELLKKG